MREPASRQVGNGVKLVRLGVAVGWLGLIAVQGAACSSSGDGGDPNRGRFLAAFIDLCDSTVDDLLAETDRAFYVDAYAVRALAVASDLTHDARYLEACRQWSDRMVAYQAQMLPSGAYFMNYGRPPGVDSGNWYVADSASIASAILATRNRTADAARRQRYLDSVEGFAQLTLREFVQPSGGVSDGFWPESNDAWWCSTALFSSLLSVLFEESGDPGHRQAAVAAVDWLLGFDYRLQAEHPSFQEGAPAVLVYLLEAYAAARAVSILEDRTPAVAAAYGGAVGWMLENQDAQGGWSAAGAWGPKAAGLPFHLLFYARNLQDDPRALIAAERGLESLAGTLSADSPGLPEDRVFGLLSLAERLSPGTIYGR